MQINEHRIYQYMSEPFRFCGLTIDELAIAGTSVLGAMLASSLINKGLFVLLGTIGLFGLKRFKKIVAGFSLYSFLHWQFGLRFGLPRNWPESWKRFWLP
jgi:hypothetical protein